MHMNQLCFFIIRLQFDRGESSCRGFVVLAQIRAAGAGGNGWGCMCVGGCVYVCATELQSPSEVDSCQARSTALRQGLTKRLNTALGFPASMG